MQTVDAAIGDVVYRTATHFLLLPVTSVETLCRIETSIPARSYGGGVESEICLAWTLGPRSAQAHSSVGLYDISGQIEVHQATAQVEHKSRPDHYTQTYQNKEQQMDQSVSDFRKEITQSHPRISKSIL